MKLKIYTILVVIFSFLRRTEIAYQYLDSDVNISLDFILLYLNSIIVYLLYKSRDKYRFLFISILIMSMIDLLINARLYIEWIHVLD